MPRSIIHRALILFSAVALFSAICRDSVAQEKPVIKTVRPERTDKLLPNPGIGWQTFHRTSQQDKNLPKWLPSTVHYARWGWRKLEPQPGKIDTGFMDGVLKQSRQSGQKLAFRVMCCSTYPRHPYHPDWLKEKNGRIIQAAYGTGPKLPVPDLDDPVVLECHLDFLRRLGKRYDGHADIDHIDLGSVGWWGEWHMSDSKTAKMPSEKTQRRIVDTYLESFKKTPLVMLIGGGKMLKYAVEKGCGWRADCLGDMGGFSKTWCHMRKGYPFWIKQAGIQDAWKTAPVAWESGWDLRRWVKEDWSLRFIFNYALALHGSYLNNKSAPLPDDPKIRAEIQRFVRRLGYRLVLCEMQHPAAAVAGGELKLSMKWRNTGSAPCYTPCRLAYRLKGKEFSKVFAGNHTVEKWLPGSVPLFTNDFFRGDWELPEGRIVNVSESIELPANIPPGDYELGISVVGVRSPKPAIRLGIQGRTNDGWYPVSSIRIGRQKQQ